MNSLLQIGGIHNAPISSSSKMNGNVVAPIPKLADTMKAEVPDAANWTITDVVQFFVEMGFLLQADVFRDQVVYIISEINRL